LGEKFKEAINTGGEKVTSVQSTSGITVEAEVQDVGPASAAKAPAPAAAGLSAGAIVAIVLVPLLCCAGVSWYFLKTKTAKEDTVEMHETGMTVEANDTPGPTKEEHTTSPTDQHHSLEHCQHASQQVDENNRAKKTTLAAVVAIMVILSMLVIVAVVVASEVPRGGLLSDAETGRGQQL
jgi:hypothetical protein